MHSVDRLLSVISRSARQIGKQSGRLCCRQADNLTVSQSVSQPVCQPVIHLSVFLSAHSFVSSSPRLFVLPFALSFIHPSIHLFSVSVVVQTTPKLTDQYWRISIALSFLWNVKCSTYKLTLLIIRNVATVSLPKYCFMYEKSARMQCFVHL